MAEDIKTERRTMHGKIVIGVLRQAAQREFLLDVVDECERLAARLRLALPYLHNGRNRRLARRIARLLDGMS